MELVCCRTGRNLGGYSDYLENTRSYFLSCFVVIPNLKDTAFGGVYGMDQTSDFGACNYCAIERYHRVRSLGESNKQVAWQAKLTARGFEEQWQLAAWVKRLDDKELICFSCHNLFLYFDPMSKTAVWKERLGGTGRVRKR